jgi:UDPglucose 6-dehydrogenase
VKHVSVIGLGKLGAPMAACIAARGFRVTGVDLNPQKVDCMKRGVAPVKEPGLTELIAEAGRNLEATTNTAEAVHQSSATFVVVATPSEESGGFSLQYALPTCEAIGRAIGTKKEYHLVVMTSTVMPGSTGGALKEALERSSGKKCGRDFGLCYSPEFIALGTVIRDFYNPDFLLIGEGDARAGDELAEMYKAICKNAPPMARMSFINAEITKLAVNTYITTKISYANMLARLCERLPGADVNVVTDALGLDTRIGAKYLKGAVSYGGPCFPRDNRALANLAAKVGASSGLAEATDRFNRAQIKSLAEMVKAERSGDETIGILGLTYKPNTDVVEEAFGLLLAQDLAAAKLPVVVFDPLADADRVAQACNGAKFAKSAEECVAQSGVVVLATPWREFEQIPAATWPRSGSARVVIDCWRALGHLATADGVRYVRLGFGESSKQAAAQTVLVR